MAGHDSWCRSIQWPGEDCDCTYDPDAPGPSQHGTPTPWWDQPRVQEPAFRQGWLVFARGTTDKIMCPKCKVNPIVYNGNYFCAAWDYTCDWALPHPVTSRRDREICDKIGVDYG